MTRGPIRVGIIGCGNVLGAYRAAIERLRVDDHVEVLWACGRPGQREPTLSQFKTARFTTEAAEVIEAAETELVLILTSMNQHAGLARAALEAGKHVLVEKPMATSLDDANSLVELAARSRGHLLCAPFTVLSPTYQAMARHIRRGDIGRPCSARARYGWSGPWWSEWFYQPGGGCIADLGIYCITSLTGLLGPARRVSAMAGVVVPSREINGRSVAVKAEDNAHVLLDFGQSAFGVVTTGFTLQQYRGPALEVYGTSGTIQMLGDDWDPDGYELWENQIGAWKVFKETAPDWSWTDGLRHLVELIQRGGSPLVTPQHSRHVLEIVLKAKQSAVEGQTLALDTTFEPPAFPERVVETVAHRIHDRSREHSS